MSQLYTSFQLVQNMSLSVHTDPPVVRDASKTIANNRGWRFWAIFSALCVTALLSAIEATGSFFTGSNRR
jgi:hypothetical protein